jgi:acetyl-CoA C-acetyltransferase
MASRGIRDRVAIIGMGCTEFGEHWDRGVDDMVSAASYDALNNAGVEKDSIDAA